MAIWRRVCGRRGRQPLFPDGQWLLRQTLNASGFPSGWRLRKRIYESVHHYRATVQDYFTIGQLAHGAEGQNDDDLGSGGALLLPTLNDALGNPHALAVGAGKDGTAYVVDRNNMGKFNMSSNAVFQRVLARNLRFLQSGVV